MGAGTARVAPEVGCVADCKIMNVYCILGLIECLSLIYLTIYMACARSSHLTLAWDTVHFGTFWCTEFLIQLHLSWITGALRLLLAQEVRLAKRNTLVSQDIICSRGVEKDIRQHYVLQI